MSSTNYLSSSVIDSLWIGYANLIYFLYCEWTVAVNLCGSGYVAMETGKFGKDYCVSNFNV